MKKIIAIISASVVAVLLAVTIILACTFFNATSVVNDGVWAIEVYRNGTTQIGTYLNGSDTFNDIMDLYKKSLKENNLSSLFQGAKNFDWKLKNEQTTISTITNNQDGKYVVNFQYSEDQELTIDGVAQVDEESSTEETIVYDQLYLEVSNTENYTEYKVYLVDGSSSNVVSYYNVSLIAHQSDLYNYIAEM